MSILSAIYYVIGLSFVITKCEWITSPFEKTFKNRRMDEMDAEFKGKSQGEYSDEYKKHLRDYFFVLTPVIWMFLGLFTIQWVVFLVFIIFNMLIIAPISNLRPYSNLYTAIHWVNSWIGLAFSVFVIVNHFHLNIDTTAAAQNIFNSLLELLSSNP